MQRVALVHMCTLFKKKEEKCPGNFLPGFHEGKMVKFIV